MRSLVLLCRRPGRRALALACGPRGWRALPRLHSASPLAGPRAAPPLAAALRHYSAKDGNYRKSHPLPEEEGEEEPPQNEWSWLPLYAIIAGLAYLLTSTTDPVPEVTYPYFLQHMLHSGEVQRLEVSSSRDRVYVFLHRGAIINGREVRRHGPQFVFTVSSVESLEEKLSHAQDSLRINTADRVPVTYRSQSDTLALVLAALVALVVVRAGYYFAFQRRRGGGGAGGLDTSSFNPFSYMNRAKTVIVTEPSLGGTRFSDVAGMEEAKREVMEFVDYLCHPQRFSQLGARIPKGALLHGPPGTGKTLLSRAIASEAGVPFLSIAGPDFVEMFAGVGSARVRDLFAQARRHAPCIVYIDEIDAVGRSRRSGAAVEGHNEQENTLNQLLVEMDGINPLEGVVMLASTNRVDILDSALLRPGRFDRQITIDLPTLPERKAIFEVYLQQVTLEKPLTTYSSRLAALTPGHSGADIANIVNEAALHAARGQGVSVSTRNFDYAVERVIAGMERRNRLGPEERRVVATHEAGHALVAWLLEHTDPVMKVSIVPRTKGALGFAQVLPLDQHLYTSEQLFDRMCMTLGGRAAEAISFKKVTTGAQDDLEKVTELAYQQVAEFGMSASVGHVSLERPKRGEPGRKPYSSHLAKLIDHEVRALVGRAYQHTESLLLDNRAALDKLAVALLEREVLDHSDLAAILGPLPHPSKLQRHQELSDLW